MEDRRPGWCDRRSVLLKTLYRMHGDICAWASAASYDGLLHAAPPKTRIDYSYFSALSRLTHASRTSSRAPRTRSAQHEDAIRTRVGCIQQ